MKKIIVINLLVALMLLFLVESISSITWYQRERNKDDGYFASVYLLRQALSGVEGILTSDSKYKKLNKLLELREQGIEAYPFYLHDPQLHVDQTVYYLTNPGDATIVYCDENGFWTIYETDENGFRNPDKKVNERVDFVFIGDSFAEGACVHDEDTFAGNFRKQGYSVLNLGRGGSGPLLQLAILREYTAVTKPDKVIWFVFTGNDLRNLREEKTTALFNYLVDENYTQDLYRRRSQISKNIKAFLDDEISSNVARREKGKVLDYNHGYGETLDIIEAREKEKYLLERSAAEILKTTNSLGADLFIVIINHYAYSRKIQKLTRDVIVDFAEKTNTDFFEIPRDQLVSNKDTYYSPKGPHFSPEGYGIIAEQVLSALESIR